MWKMLVVAALALSSCQKQKVHESTYATETGQLKSSITMLPIINNADCNLSWNLANELTDSIAKEIQRENHFLVSVPNGNKVKDPFAQKFSWVKEAFPKDRFVVFMELLEHKEHFTKTSVDSPASLNLVMRLRVFDVRGEKPKVILQELVENSYYVPEEYTQSSDYQPVFGEEGFSRSPIGRAHSAFTRAIARKIDQYIGLHN